MSFIYAISPIQCKVARTHLDLTQKALADLAQVGRSTVRKFEDGDSVRRESVIKIRKACEAKGIEFTEGNGVKQRGSVIVMLQGSDSHEKFYDDLLHTSKDHGGDILCIAKSQAQFLRACGVRDSHDFKRLEFLSKMARIKLLITDPSTPAFNIPHVECRTTKGYISTNPSFFFGYGNKYVHALEEDRTDIVFAIYHIAHSAHSYRILFLELWENAMLLLVNTAAPKNLAALSANA